MNKKIIRSICCFTDQPSKDTLSKLDEISQTKRACSPVLEKVFELDRQFTSEGYIFGLGSIPREQILNHLKELGQTYRKTQEDVTVQDLSKKMSSRARNECGDPDGILNYHGIASPPNRRIAMTTFRQILNDYKRTSCKHCKYVLF